MYETYLELRKTRKFFVFSVHPVSSVEEKSLMSHAFRLIVVFFLLCPSHVTASEELLRGTKLFESRQYDAAVEVFRNARVTETRPEVRQKLIAMGVRSLYASGRTAEAYQEFFQLCRMDPFSTEFDCIPLVWFPESFFPSVGISESEKLALQWMHPKSNPSGMENPAASLLACSILLSSTQTQNRSKAVEQLQQLTFLVTEQEKNAFGKKANEQKLRRQIAALAQTQLWRTKIAAVKDEKELATWKTLLETLPDSLRAGPCFLLGTAYAKLEKHEKAVLVWMNNPILYPDNRPVAAKSLLESAKSLRRLERPKNAQTLLEEILRDYADQKSIAESAAALLKAN